MGNIVAVTDANFDETVLQSSEPVLVDFWAPWCGPCRMIAPMIEELATEAVGVKVVKVNTDEAPQTATHFSVNSIPTLMIFKNGEVVERLIGAQPKNRLLDALEQAKD